MQRQYEEQEADKAKLQEDMQRLRSYYDSRIANVDSDVKSSAEGEFLFTSDSSSSFSPELSKCMFCYPL